MTELNFNRTGEGPPLLILHGLFGSGKNWSTLARRFAERFEVFTLDLRNHGHSFHADAMNYDVMAEDVVRLVESLGLNACSMLGHSMGGKVAMTFARKHPEQLSRLLVADIAPVAYRHEYDDLIEPILALDLSAYASRIEIDHALRPNIPEDQLRAFLLHNLARQPDGWAWRVNWSAIQDNMNELVGFDALPEEWSTDLPTLFLRGANSGYVGETEVEVIERHFNRARVVTIEGAGHWLHAEKPDAFYAEASRFFDEG